MVAPRRPIACNVCRHGVAARYAAGARGCKTFLRDAARCSVLVLLVFMSVGCPTTRLPTIVPRPGDADKRSFDVHDPLPETDIGPDTGARPRGFMQERSEPRRTQEAEALLGVPPGGTERAGMGPGAPAGGPMGPPMGGPPAGAPVGPGGPPVGPSSQLYPDAVPQ